LDWLNTQKKIINELLNTTDFNIIQKQITENIEPSDVAISSNIDSNELESSLNNNKKNGIVNENIVHNNNKHEIFDEPPPSLSDFTKNIVKVEDELKILNNNPLKIDNSKKLSISNLSSISAINKSESQESLFNRTNLKEVLSIESLNPLIEEIINKNARKSSSLYEKRKSSILRTLDNSINENNESKVRNNHSFPYDLKDKIENRNLIINKIENNDIFKKNNDNSERLSLTQSSTDVITDLKRSLSNYTARKKKSTLLSINDTIDSSATLKNNDTTTNLLSMNLDDDTLGGSTINNTMVNINVPSIKMEYDNTNDNNNGNNDDIINVNNDDDNKKVNEDEEEKPKKRFSTLLEEVEMNYNNLLDDNSNEFKDCEMTDAQNPRTPIKSKSESTHHRNSSGYFKDCDELLNTIFGKSKSTEKPKIKTEIVESKRSVTTTALNIFTSPFSPFSHSGRKSKLMTTPDKKDILSSEGSKKSVSERFKALWDSTTKGLHYAFSRNPQTSTNLFNTSENENENENDTDSDKFKTGASLSPNIKLYYSPERDSVSSPFVNNNNNNDNDDNDNNDDDDDDNTKTINIKVEKEDKDIKLKPGSTSVPSKVKANLFDTTMEDFNTDFKENNATSFATAIQSPSDSPLALISAKKLEKKNNELNVNLFKSMDNDSESKSIFNTNTNTNTNINNSNSNSNNDDNNDKTNNNNNDNDNNNNNNNNNNNDINNKNNIFSSNIASSPLLYNKFKTNTNILKKSNSSNNLQDTLSQSPSKYLYYSSLNNTNNSNKLISMNIDGIGKENKLLKKSVSDLTDNNLLAKEDIKKEITSSIMGSSWNNIYGLNSNKEQASLIPKNSKLKKANMKKAAKDKLKALDSSKLIKKHELPLDKKQKIRLNAERHMLYLKKKKEEEEKLAAAQKQKIELKKIKTEPDTRTNKQKQLEMEILIKKRNEKIKQVNEKKKALKSKEIAKSILLNNSNIYGTSSILDKIKTLPYDTNAILKKKNSNSTSTIKKPKLSGSKNTSISNILSNNTKKSSSIPKSKLTRKSKSNTSTTNFNINSANTSTQNILSGLNNPPTKPIILGLNNLDESNNKNDDTSIISIASSRSSTTPYKGTIIKDGEFPEIPSDYEEEDSRTSLVATWAKTPNLVKELERQKNINPDEIFGGCNKPCHLDEIFKGMRIKRHNANENWADTSSILRDDE